ncbi:protein transport protein Sft2p [Trichomonascus vanleenenianus]|uniref:Sft2p n=1 Tax=Trichomonascus vanleenenianus TaxID=2268995 RepID=UPI003ECA5913
MSSENAFRNQLNTWRNSLPSTSFDSVEQPSNFFSKIKSWNPFQQENYVRLPVSEREQPDIVEEPEWFNLSRWDRLLIFSICLLGAAACFALCFFLLPLLAVKPRKFAVLWSLGSLLFIISFGVLQGPLSYLKHLTSAARLPFTIAYFGSIFATLVFSLGMRSVILTVPAIIVQILAALWYAVSYFPMGSQGLRFASRVGARQVTSWINS